MSADSHSRAYLAPLMRTNSHCQVYLVLPMRTNSYRQAHLELPVKADSYQQLCLVQKMSTARCRQPQEVLAQRYKGVGVTSTEKMGLLLPIPLQASAKKSNPE